MLIRTIWVVIRFLDMIAKQSEIRSLPILTVKRYVIFLPIPAWKGHMYEKRGHIYVAKVARRLLTRPLE